MRCHKYLTHWGRVTHICVGTNTNIGSDNGLSPERRQVIIWTNAGILLIGPLGTNFSEILITIHTFSFKEMDFKMSSAKWRPCCLSFNVLKTYTMQDKASLSSMIDTMAADDLAMISTRRDDAEFSTCQCKRNYTATNHILHFFKLCASEL